MRRAMTMFALMFVGCGRPPASDDEVGEATEIGEESTATDTSNTESFVTQFDMDPVSSCDPFAQDCQPDEKCVPYASGGGSWDANKCVPVTGDQHVGEPCNWDGLIEATDDCDATSMCWNAVDVDGELIGECLPFCSGTADEPECPDEYSCEAKAEGSTVHCDPTCDPLLQDCGAGSGCFWSNTNFICTLPADDIPTGEPCGHVSDCALGNYCTEAAVLPDCAGPACCTKYCDLELGDIECAVVPGTACVTFFEDETAPLGHEDVGICIVP